ncbi:MAG TPA: ASKHA domain-containing protein, partial [Candidatus Hydrogenedens sp.]|nr:ASKHA domain-containing protein [Candidatus Hydrogenedens sp.]
ILHLEKPTFDDTCSYLTRLFQKIGKRHVPIKIFQQLPDKMRETNFSGVLIYNDEEILDWIPEKECEDIFGVAIDLGTTSIGIELVNLSSGESICTLSELNPQVLYGDDVISRISYVTQSEDNLKTIQKKVITGINNIIERLIDDAGIKKQFIYDGVIAGNTTMLHLLLGVNPKSLGECPFVPVFDTSIKVFAEELGINIHSTGQIYILPSIGGFIGGDIIAGLIALNLFNKKEPFLFIDLGTNGEIVLGNHEQILAASTAVGPAFEGARIECGMRAATGAIEHIIYDGEDIKIQAIDNVEPIGLCGSAMIDLLAILLQLGIVDITGRMLSKENISSNIPQKIRERIKNRNSEVIFEVFNNENEGRKIFLSAKDVRQLQLACAAIKCGIKLLTDAAKIKMSAIENIYIAGTFGYHLDKKSLKSIGIIPYEINDEKIHFVGNTSLAGAKCALLNKDVRNISEQLARSIKHIDLSTIPTFEEEFAMSTYFPEQSQKTND